jgi:hypothetical protein
LQDFKNRFVSLLGYDFASFSPALALAVLQPAHMQGTTGACHFGLSVADFLLEDM